MMKVAVASVITARRSCAPKFMQSYRHADCHLRTPGRHCEYTTASRFFVKKIRTKTQLSDDELTAHLVGSNVHKVNNGAIYYNSSKELTPIQDGKLQKQYATKIRVDDDECIVCGFHGSVSKEAEVWESIERPVDEVVAGKIHRVLRSRYPHINIADLDNDRGPLAGTPPSRIYRSLIRAKSPAGNDGSGEETDTILMDAMVDRGAVQIDLALRQLEADRSQYLRNTDIAKNYRLQQSGSEDPSVTQQDSQGGSSPYEINPIVLVLDNLRSAYNVGTIYRTAETAGIHHIVTCGITPSPPHPKVLKTALTSCESIPTEHFDDVSAAVTALRKDGYTIVALETTSRSLCHTEVKYPPKTALVVGHEKSGVSDAVMRAADMIVEIPTYGQKNSLNVVSATSIVLFEVLRQWKSV